MTDSGNSNVLLISGIPGVGKTTVIRKLICSLPASKATGFYTEEVRRNNVRQGFELVTLQGKRFIMAHVDNDSSWRVGKYGVDISAIDTVVATTLSGKQDVELFIIDEIGKMECFSDLFVQRVTSLIESGKVVVATVAMKGSGFILEVKNSKGAELWEVTQQIRDTMPFKIANWILEKKEALIR